MRSRHLIAVMLVIAAVCCLPVCTGAIPPRELPAGSFEPRRLPFPERKAMPLVVTANEVLPRAMRGIADLIAATAQFQVETGENAGDSLDGFIHWPEVAEADSGGAQFTVPMALITHDVDQIIAQPTNDLAKGELFLQIALLEDSEIIDRRDRWTDAANRAGAIIRQMLALARGQTHEYWPITAIVADIPSLRNNPSEYRLVDPDNGDVSHRCRVFTYRVQWTA